MEAESHIDAIGTRCGLSPEADKGSLQSFLQPGYPVFRQGLYQTGPIKLASQFALPFETNLNFTVPNDALATVATTLAVPKTWPKAGHGTCTSGLTQPKLVNGHIICPTEQVGGQPLRRRVPFFISFGPFFGGGL